MAFVTKIFLSSGDRRAVKETIENIKKAIKQKGTEYSGPYAGPTRNITVPLYPQLRTGTEFSSWNYSVYRQSIKIHGSNEVARSVVDQKFPDSIHIEVEIEKEGNETEMEKHWESVPTDPQDTARAKGNHIKDSKQDVEKTNIDNGSSRKNGPPKSKTGLKNEQQDELENKSTPELDTDLEKLREQAIEDSIESVPDNYTTTTQKTQQYSRSKAVRNYVMSRAGGQCEGCGEPAPFTSKTGEPYLHGHHVDELSDGGSDKPRSVIALCPNCHYRVHHGKDGEKYNQKLKTRVQKIETHLDG